MSLEKSPNTPPEKSSESELAEKIKAKKLKKACENFSVNPNGGAAILQYIKDHSPKNQIPQGIPDTPQDDIKESEKESMLPIRIPAGTFDGKEILEKEVDTVEKPVTSLDLVDIEPYVDLYAEQFALEEYDREMEKRNKGFGKVTGFFKRATLRIGRGAYIESLKQEKKREIYQDIAKGALTYQDIINYTSDADNAIVQEVHLDEEKQVSGTLDIIFKDHIRDIFASMDPNDRKVKIQTLKTTIETHYQGKKIETTQLENAINRLQSSIASVDLDSLDLALNFYDMRGIGNEKSGTNNTSRVGKLTQMLDSWDEKLGNNPSMMGKVARNGIGLLRSPTFAAIASAIGIKTATSIGYLGGAIGGLAVGSTFAGIRGARERRDHHRLAQLSHVQGGSREINTKFQKELQEIIDETDYLNMDETLGYLANENISLEDRKLRACTYLAKRKSTNETGRNWIVYGDGNITQKNTEALKLIRALDTDPNWYKSGIAHDTIEKIKTDRNTKHETISEKERAIYRKYGLSQAAEFAAVGAAVGGLTYGVSSIISNMHTQVDGIINHGGTDIQNSTQPPQASHTVTQTIVTTSSHPNLFEGAINRIHLDNNTLPFDKNELRLWTTGDHQLSIAGMLHKLSTGAGLSETLSSGDLTSGNAFALMQANGHYFQIPIGADGVLQPSEDIQKILADRSFKTLEIVKTHGDHHLVFASLTGDNSADISGDITPITPEKVTIPTQPPVSSTPVPGMASHTSDPFTLPLGATRYHESQERKNTDQSSPTQPPLPKDIGDDKGNRGDGSRSAIETNERDSTLPKKILSQSIKGSTGEKKELSSPKDIERAIRRMQHEKDLKTILLKHRQKDVLLYNDQKRKTETLKQETLEKYPVATAALGENMYDKAIEGYTDLYNQAVAEVALLEQEIATIDNEIQNLTDKLEASKEREKPEQPKISQDSSENTGETLNSQTILNTEKSLKEAFGESARIVPLKTNSGEQSIVTVYPSRLITIVEIQGVRIPFYTSSGTGGKKETKVGGWYPFFGLGTDNWINKTRGSEMAEYYHSPVLRKVATILEGNFGDISEGDILNVSFDSTAIEDMNTGFSPATNDENMQASYDRMRNALAFMNRLEKIEQPDRNALEGHPEKYLRIDANGRVEPTLIVPHTIEIPSTLDGISVKRLPSFSFAYRKITEINLPEGLEEMGQGALAYTQLKTVHIPKSLTTIGDNAFDGNPDITFTGAIENLPEKYRNNH